MFDPIPTQIESNIHCITDPSRAVVGYFAAAGIVRKSHYFAWEHSSPKLTEKGLDSIVHFPANACDTSVTPAFWVTSY